MALQGLSDEEIRSTLAAHGVSNIPPITVTSRPLLLKKIQRLTTTPAEQEETGPSDKLNTSSPGSNGNAGTPTQQQDSVSIEGYYVVVLEESSASPDNELASQPPPIYTSKKAALKAIKNNPGARMHEFDSQECAEKFTQESEINKKDDFLSKELLTKSTDKPLVGEKANNFPSLKTQDLSKFRKMIEAGDLDKFVETVWANPRHLISSGDAPTILKPPTWYNALHCAVLSGRVEFCQEIMTILQDDQFWSLVYPDDSEEIRVSRKEHLVDLYLNMQDKLNYETPLHFASKFGHVDIVSYLLSFPTIAVNVCNKYKETPTDLVCKKAAKSSVEDKQRIKELLNEPENVYVSVLRSLDNSSPPHLSTPCQLHEISPALNKTDTPIVEHALAGPMSPSLAEEFYREWRSPSDSRERKDARNVKRSDPDRGLERVGRRIAHRRGVGWVEYWSFLRCSCDLSSIEGQQKLEEYLSQSFLKSTPSSKSLNCTNTQEDPLVVRLADQMSPTSAMDDVPCKLFVDERDTMVSGETDSNKKDLNPVGDLAQLLEDKLSLDSSEEKGTTKESANMPQDSEDLITMEGETASRDVSDSDMTLGDKGFTTPVKMSTPHVADQVFLAGSHPTKLDYDVMLALGECEPEPSQLPFICRWLELVKSYSEKEQASWRTPKKQWTFKAEFTHPVSPLVIASPSSGSRHLPTFSPLINAAASPGRNGSTASPLRQTPVRTYHNIGGGASSSQRRTPAGYRPVTVTPLTGHSPLHSSRHESRTTATASVAGRATLASRF